MQSTENIPNILRYKERLRPYEYEQFEKAHVAVVQSPWSWLEVSMVSDIVDWGQLDEKNRTAIAGILKGFTLIESGIGCYWREIVAQQFGHHEIRDMATAFAHTEVIHKKAYDHLEATLGFDTYDAFRADPVASQKLDYIFNKNDNPDDLALSLAIFSGAAEGVSLYSSFATLMSYNRLGLFKGMWQILSWSVRDECLMEDTEILVEKKGWVKIQNYEEGDKIAQFDPETKEITYIVPSSYIRTTTQQIYRIHDEDNYSQNVTENHRVLLYDQQGMPHFYTAKDLWLNQGRYFQEGALQMPIAGHFHQEYTPLTALDKLKIILGTEQTYYSHVRKNSHRLFVKLAPGSYQERILIDLLEIINEEYPSLLGWFTVNTSNQNEDGSGSRYYYIYLNKEKAAHDYGHLDLFLLNNHWSTLFPNATGNLNPYEFKSFLLSWKWDAEAAEPSRSICNLANKENLLFAKELLALANCAITYKIEPIYHQRRMRSDTFRLIIDENITTAPVTTKNLACEYLLNPVPVYCFQVPTGAFVIRSDNKVSITGNCLHSMMGMELYRQLIKEAPELKPNRNDIYDGFVAIVENELAFLRNVFAQGDLMAITEKECYDFVFYRANKKLMELGLNPLYDLSGDYRDLKHYFDTLIQGKSFHDFFALARNGGGYSSMIKQDFSTCDFNYQIAV